MKNSKKLFLFFIALVFCGLIIFPSTSFAKKKQKGPVEIDVQVRDGFHIVANLDIPKRPDKKTRLPLVIFMHSIGQNTNEWGAFPTEVKDKLNVATLNINLRGHGKSIVNKNSRKVYWQNFQQKEFEKIPYDIIDVLKYVKDQYPEIETSRTAIVGSGLGANMALISGSNGISVKTIVMLSPMLNYKGYDLRLPIVKYGNHPLLFMVSKQDTYPYKSCLELIKFAQGKKMLKVYPYGGTGVMLLKFQPDAKPLVVNWVKDGLGIK